MARRSAHHDLDRNSCLDSLYSSQRNGRLREGKEYIFQIVVARRRAARRGERLEILNRALAANAAISEKHKAVAQPGCVADLMDGEKQRAPSRREFEARRRHPG